MAGPVDLKAAGDRVFKTRAGRLFYLVTAIAVATLVGYGSCTTYVKPNEFGIKQVTWGTGKGVKPDIYRTGLHWVTPGAERMHRFPTDLQILNLTSDSSERERDADDARAAPALNIQTSEGYKVSVDISVLYRIVDPYKVITQVGPGRLYEDSLVIPRSEQTLRKTLGELDAEEFYDVQKRLSRLEAATAALREQLEPAGLSVVNIFVRRYTYDDRYEKAIEARKVQDQSVFKNKAEADMASANAEKDRIVAVGEAAMKVELARGDAEKKKLEAEADLYERKQRAAGELQVKLAEAEGTRLENAALQGQGSEYMVGLKMADVLKNTKVIILPTDGPNGTNPLDLKRSLERFDVK
ncbi:MAG TPA: SPFH domain-containing protein [Myxococcaceae bacterium]|nr:SPFH domain-containing protein [Myxococcaceae bacterium]